jgi:hypothetical protein
MAHGALLSGQIANQIFYMGSTLTEYRLEILLLVIFMVFLVVGPLLVFSPQLAETKRTGLREYGTLAQDYVRRFDSKWVHPDGAVDEQFLGSGDIQSLADLGNSYEVLRSMRVVPVTKETMFQLAVATVVPIVPLVLTLMPLEELLRKLLGILF